MTEDHLLCPAFELRGKVYEIWTNPMDSSNRRLVDPRKREDVDTDKFDPPLTNDELLSIYDYGKGY